MVPLSPLAQMRIPSLLLNIDLRLSPVPLGCCDHVWPPFRVATIVPFKPAAHTRIPSVVPETEAKVSLVPLV
jgi:hypothetical protein